MKNQIAILDFGSQYTHLIARRCRQLGVLAKIYPPNIDTKTLKQAWGIILSGGPDSITEEKIKYNRKLFELGIPLLGFCYGHQLMAKIYGGKVESQHQREYGKAKMTVMDKSPIFKGLNKKEQVWMSHWDIVAELPEGFKRIGKTSDCTIAAMADDQRKAYGFQYHPEVQHTLSGMIMLKNFLFTICKAKKNWSMEQYFKQLQKDIKGFVGKRKVFLFVSGGVDSSVAFALLEKILGKERVFGLHVDTGFMRKNESAQVKKALARAGFDDLQIYDASDRYLMALQGKTEPEEKRKIIGKIFLDVQHDVFTDMEFKPKEWLLGQGTIYPDTIETGGTKSADTIKTHHNRVPEVVAMIKAGKIIEPLSELYKDEVREIGKQLKLPKKLIERWPFPGPGLAIRCLCSNKTVKLKSKKIDQQITKHLEKVKLKGKRLPVKSVGVQGDLRTYQNAVVIKDATKQSWGKQENVAVDMVNKIQGINRVVAHVGGKLDFKKMKLVPAYLTEARLDILREADAIVKDVVQEHKIYKDIWQFPVILLPLTFSGKGETIVLRPIESEEAMTVNFYPMKKNVLNKLVKKLLDLRGVDTICYDITNKPPGTIEWE